VQSSWQPQVEHPTLNSLRHLPGLYDQANQHVNALGLWDDPWTGGTASSRRMVSGRGEKLDSGIVTPAVWPHSRLEYNWCGGVKFDQLDFPLLVAGECAIILHHNTPLEEKQARLHLLKRCAYHLKNNHPWDRVRQYFAAALTSVERGATWEKIDHNELANSILTSRTFAPAQPTASGRTQEFTRKQQNLCGSGRWYCLNYQLAACKIHGPHEGTVNNSKVTVEHFCSHCCKSGEFLFHPKILCEKYRTSLGHK